METILKSVLCIKAREMSSLCEVNGNVYLMEALSTLPAYNSKREIFKSEMKGKQKDTPYWVDRKYIISLIPKLYEKNGEHYGSTRSLELCLDGCFNPSFGLAVKKVGNKEVRFYKESLSLFFETKIRESVVRKKSREGVVCRENKIHWIDTFSALDMYAGIFGGEGTSFSDFLSAYSSLVEKMHNRKLEAFYPRSLDDIAAAYTIYAHKTTKFFKEMRQRLIEAREEGRASLTGADRSDCLLGETNVIREDFVERILKACSEDTEATIDELCRYVKAHPGYFETYRHYFAIREIIVSLIKPRGLLIGDGELMEIFASDTAYSVKDKKIFNFEYEVYSYLYHLAARSGMEYELCELVLSKNMVAIDEKRMIKSISTERRGASASAENTLRMLRHIAVLLEIKQSVGTKKRHDFMTVSRKTLEKNINRSLAVVGVKSLSPASETSYTSGEGFDWCISRYIEKSLT